MKIIVTGPHCSGKTTVIRKTRDLVVHERTNIQFLLFKNDCPFDYSDHGNLERNPKTVERITWWMIAQFSLRELSSLSSSEHQVFDRGMIDELVYPTAILGSKRVPHVIRDFVKRWHEEEPYDHVFVVPKNEDFLRMYGKKDRSMKYVRRVDELYHELVSKYCPHHTFLPKNQEEQVITLRDFMIKECK